MPVQSNEIARYRTVEAVLDTVADWIHHCRQLAVPSALSKCDSGEIERMASDLGMSSQDLRVLAQARPESADLLQKMLPALGIDPKKLSQSDPLVMRDLQWHCVTCQNKKRCRRELEEFAASEHFHDFCPNAVTLDALLKERSN